MVDKRIRRKSTDYSKSNITAHIKEAMKDLIVKTGCSIGDAAAKFDIDECKAEYILFSKKPTKEQFAHAFEIYDKGFPFMMACVASGVSMKAFKTARREKASTQYRPERW